MRTNGNDRRASALQKFANITTLTKIFVKARLEANAPRISDTISHWQGKKRISLMCPRAYRDKDKFGSKFDMRVHTNCDGSKLCLVSARQGCTSTPPVILERRRREWWWQLRLDQFQSELGEVVLGCGKLRTRARKFSRVTYCKTI